MQKIDQLKEDARHEPRQTACASTLRAAIVSPFPDRLHPLIQQISSGCFDILLFHRLDSLLGSGLLSDVYIFDLTHMDVYEVSNIEAFIAHPERQIRSLFLTKEGTQWNHPFINRTQLLIWPIGSQDIMSSIQFSLRSSVLQTYENASNESTTYKDLHINPKKMAVYRGREQLSLTKTEYEILLSLLNAKGVLTREEILNQVWGSQFAGGSNVVDAHVKSLRKKLGDKADAPAYIVTVRGIGYRLADL
jgi:two-component system, OmpR family, alkaline phosphatase synthesis response regulator PhoP